MPTAKRWQDQPTTNTPEVKAFMQSVRDRDVAAIRSYLRKTPDLVHAYDYEAFGATALIHAANQQNRELVDLLLKAGADINQRSDWWAGSNGVLPNPDSDVADFLIDRGAKVDAHTLAELDRADELRAMIAADPACVNQRGGDGVTPLGHAASPAIAKILLDAGAEIDSRCIDHESTAAQYAAKTRTPVAKYLVERGAEMDIVIASATNDTTALANLINADESLLHDCIREDVFATSDNTNALQIYFYVIGRKATPLHVAAMTDACESAKWLLENGANANARGAYDDAAPLHFAAWEDNPAVARVLIDSGADIN